MEFHLPYFALRRADEYSDHKIDKRSIHGRKLRLDRPLPLAKPGTDEERDFYYETQLSFLVIGVDEWWYTSYCLVDTYYQGCEEHWKTYLSPPGIREPATGGKNRLETSTIWNPREYFLAVLARRLRQATSESIALLEEFEDRLFREVPNTPL